MSVLSLLVASVLVLSAIPIASATAARATVLTGDSSVANAVTTAQGVTKAAADSLNYSCISNGFLTAQVNDSTGKYDFSAGSCATAGNVSNRVLYGKLSTRFSTSFVTVADFTTGVEYTESGSGGGASLGTPTSSSVSGESIITAFPPTAEGLVVTQNMTVVGSNFFDSVIMMNVKVVNTNVNPQKVGIRYLWDWQVGGYDGTWLQEYAGTTAGPITGYETTYDPSPSFTSYAMNGCSQSSVGPPPYTCDSSDFGTGSGASSVFGSISYGPGATSPARFVYGWWAAMFGTAYGYAPNPLNEVGSYVPNNGGFQDSAVLYYFSNKTIPGTGGVLSDQADIGTSSSVMRASSGLTVLCNLASMAVGLTTTCKALVRSSHSLPTGSIAWSSSRSGAFSSMSCELSVRNSYSACSVKFVPTTTGSVIITADYGGDSRNSPSAGTYDLTVTKRGTFMEEAYCMSKFAVAGSSKTTTCVADPDCLPPLQSKCLGLTGTVRWSQTGTGSVSFNSTTCILEQRADPLCFVAVTGVKGGNVTITATYLGSSYLKGTSGTTELAVAEAID